MTEENKRTRQSLRENLVGSVTELKETKTQEKKQETSKEIVKDIEKTGVPGEVAKQEEKLDEKVMKESEKKEDKKPVQEKPKKTEAFVSSQNIPISTKHSMAIGKFIKNKEIGQAIIELEQVLKLKKAVPMRGEIPHRRGKGMMSGRFPKKAAESFIKLLKSLATNADYHGLEDPIIVEVVPNIGERPFGRFGAVRKKRTHIKITARNKQIKQEKK